jgi:hypothetical protein
MIKIISTISFLLVINACLMSQASVDYNPKALQTELKKAKLTDNIPSEISVRPELASNIREGKFFSFPTNPAVSKIKYLYIGRVSTCRAGGCSINTNQKPDSSAEYFDYLIFFDASCNVVQVKVSNFQSSRGQEITSNGWLSQFKNYNGKSELNAGKNVDAITGATITVDAMTHDIVDKTRLLTRILQKI